jgi:hypothetical protein
MLDRAVAPTVDLGGEHDQGEYRIPSPPQRRSRAVTWGVAGESRRRGSNPHAVGLDRRRPASPPRRPPRRRAASRSGWAPTAGRRQCDASRNAAHPWTRFSDRLTVTKPTTRPNPIEMERKAIEEARPFVRRPAKELSGRHAPTPDVGPCDGRLLLGQGTCSAGCPWPPAVERWVSNRSASTTCATSRLEGLGRRETECPAPARQEDRALTGPH